jgi:hypothetical protein
MAFHALSIPLVLLAQPSNVGGVIGWSLVLIVLIVAGAAGVLWLRRWMKEEEDVPTTPGGIGFSLSDLRQLHREGKMTDEEFERARSKMVAAGKSLAEKLPDPLAGRRQPNQQRPGSAGSTGSRGSPPPNPGAG